MTGAEFSDGEEDGCDAGGGFEFEIGSEDLVGGRCGGQNNGRNEGGIRASGRIRSAAIAGGRDAETGAGQRRADESAHLFNKSVAQLPEDGSCGL